MDWVMVNRPSVVFHTPATVVVSFGRLLRYTRFHTSFALGVPTTGLPRGRVLLVGACFASDKKWKKRFMWRYLDNPQYLHPIAVSVLYLKTLPHRHPLPPTFPKV
jgi:hypothetical protein